MNLIPIIVSITLIGCTKLEATDTEKVKALATKRERVAYLAAPAKVQRATNAMLSEYNTVLRIDDADGVCYLYQANISCIPKTKAIDIPERSN